MLLYTHRTIEKVLLRLLLGGSVFLVVAGCALLPKTPPPQKPVSSRPHVDAKSQHHYYDLGLQHYSRENYGEAKEAFQQAVDFGPNTDLGIKAKQNLKKIEQILKTLEEIQSK